MELAKITATVLNKENDNPIYVETATMSTDLPAQQLGELITSVVHQAWKVGFDPVNTKVLVEFN